ncbi:MAG: GTPase ObgE [Anaerolineae bacterium CG2_30_64_16]|nr:MAG: GTPase ObgE [Anaerolineae bacterium CG2_30_64_16]
MFIDEAKIYVKAGDGGNGVVAFRREAHVPRGGPSGGAGGKGGDVYLVVAPQVNTLVAFSKKVHFRAPNGAHGRGKNQTGAQGEDLLISVPVGTVAYDTETGQLLADLVAPDQRALVARGGRGGRGNRAFRSATNQAPRIAENGEPGQELWLRMELKLLADVGIVGMPNAGKSTLLARVSAARPKIADYPFTTLEPSLGVVVLGDRDMVWADIPGLIEGAHAGVGLGHKFLRHVERTRVLIHLLNGTSPDPLGDYEAINQELGLFNTRLAEKPQVVVLNKLDLPDVQAAWPDLVAALRARGVAEPLAISAVTGEGVEALLYRMADLLAELPPPLPLPEIEAVPDLTPEEDMSFTIERDMDGAWRVTGRRIERIVIMTRWEYYDAVMRFQRILEALGITEALRQRGVREGDIVRIGDMQLEWSEEHAF